MNSDKQYKSMAEAYFSGRLPLEKQRDLMQWLQADASHEQLFRSWESEWAASDACRKQSDAAWAKFLEMQADAAPEKKPIVVPLWRRPVTYWVAAAVVLLLLALPMMRFIAPSAGYEGPLMAQTETFRYEASADSLCLLPDQTNVKLSPGAVLSYSSDYGIDRRAVTLEGTARFDVSKNPDCPFTVSASDFVVEVTGTVFTVVADSSEQLARVQLHEGAVSVYCNDTVYLLAPAEELTYDSGTREVVYAAQSLGGVLRRLGKRSGMDIRFSDSETMRQHVRFRLRKGQTAEDVLSALADLYQLDIQIDENTVLVNER